MVGKRCATSSSGAIGGRSNGPRTLLSRGKGRVTTVAACFEKFNFQKAEISKCNFAFESSRVMIIDTSGIAVSRQFPILASENNDFYENCSSYCNSA